MADVISGGWFFCLPLSDLEVEIRGSSKRNCLYQKMCNYLKQRHHFDWLVACHHKINLSLLAQFSSVAQLCPTLCDPMTRSTPGLPVHHHLPEFTHTLIHWVSDAIQPSHPLSSPFSFCPQSLPASESFPMSQLFTWGGQSTGVSGSASVLPVNTQGWSPLGWPGWRRFR